MGGKELGADATNGVKQEIEAVSSTTMPVSVAAREERESRGVARPGVALVIRTSKRSQQLRALESLTALSCRTEWELVVMALVAGSIRSSVFRAGLFFFAQLRFRQGAVAPSSSPEPRGYGGA